MKSKKITAAVLGIVLTLGLVVSGCGSNGSSSDGSAKAEINKDGYEVVSIGFPSAGYEWAEGALAVAEEKGYLDEYLNPLGYDADLIPFTGAAPAIHEALVSGDLDYAYYAGFAGIMAKSNGIDTKLLTVTSFGSVWQLAVSADSGITSLQDLKGKTISYQRGATPQMYVLKVLAEAGLTENDVQLVNSTIPEGLSSLSTGAVDAAVVTYGQADSLVEQGQATILHRGAQADPDTFYEPNVLTGRTAYVSENSDVTVAIIKAMLKASNDIISDPEAFYELSAEKSGRTLEQVKSVAVADTQLGYSISLDDRYITSLKNIEQFELDNKIITNQVDLDSWIDSSYLEKAVQEYQESAQ